MPKIVTPPTVHLNGTSGQELLNQWRKVAAACRDLRRALGDSAPHGRDYYVQPGNALQRARAEHEERLRHLDAIEADVEAMVEAIYPQVDR